MRPMVTIAIALPITAAKAIIVIIMCDNLIMYRVLINLLGSPVIYSSGILAGELLNTRKFEKNIASLFQENANAYAQPVPALYAFMTTLETLAMVSDSSVSPFYHRHCPYIHSFQPSSFLSGYSSMAISACFPVANSSHQRLNRVQRPAVTSPLVIQASLLTKGSEMIWSKCCWQTAPLMCEGVGEAMVALEAAQLLTWMYCSYPPSH